MMHGNGEATFDVKDKIVDFKRQMAPRREALKRAFEDVRDHVRRRADAVKAEQAAGRGVVPELDYKSIAEGSVPEATRQAIRRSGCAVIRGVFPAAQAAAWFDEVGEYLDANRYEEAEVAKRSLDKYFSAAQGRQAADLQRLLVEAAGDGAAGPETRRDAPLPRPAVEARGRVRPRTRNAPMPTACAAASPATRRSASRRTWMPARWSAGSIRATKRSTSASSPATGAATTPSTARTGSTRRKSPPPPSARCSAPTRAGRR